MTDKERRLLSRRDTIRLFGLTAAGIATAAVVGCGGDDDADSTATPAGAASATGAATTAAATTAAATTTATAAATATPSTIPTTVACVITPELTEGPYFVDERLLRSNITTDPDTGEVSEGIPLAITVTVSNVTAAGCEAIPGAVVDMWHCDAVGEYSDIANGAGQGNTSGKKFLRGYQVTDANGQVQFQTIFPGWYSGRAVHIHFKVRTDPDSSSGAEFTSQFFFDEGVIDTVMQNSVYSARGTPNVRNSTDNIYTPEMLITLAEANGGYSGSYHVGVNFA